MKKSNTFDSYCLQLKIGALIMCSFVFNQCSQLENTKRAEIPILHILEKGLGSEKKMKCTIVVNTHGKTDTLSAHAKYRGESSSQFQKHSYSLEFEEKQLFHQKLASKNWVLNASYIDRSFMRNKLSFDLFRAMSGKNKAPHCSFIWVKENNKNKGIYLLTERLDRIRLNVQKKQKSAFICKSPPLFYDSKLTINRDSLYLASMEFPKKKKKKKKALKNSKLLELETLIYSKNDDKFKKQIFQLVDQHSIIDWQLIVLFTNSSDGQLKNYCIYQTTNVSKLKIALWDYDQTFGLTASGKVNKKFMVDEAKNPLMKRLIMLNPDRFNQKLAARYNALRKTVFTEQYVFKLIRNYSLQLADYTEQNEKLWPQKKLGNKIKMNHHQDVQYLKSFVSLRLKQLDHQFQHKKS